MAAKYPVPAGVDGVAADLWREVTKTWTLRVDELQVLEDACRERMLIQRLEETLDGAELVVTGSTGQPVMHPALSELRQHRAVLARLFAQLSLPDAPDGRAQGAAAGRSDSARRAAVARWSA